MCSIHCIRLNVHCCALNASRHIQVYCYWGRQNNDIIYIQYQRLLKLLNYDWFPSQSGSIRHVVANASSISVWFMSISGCDTVLLQANLYICLCSESQMSNAFEVIVLCVASNFTIGTTFTRGAMSILSFNRQINFWSNTQFNPPFYLNDFQNSDFTSSFNSQTMALKSACSAHLLTEIFRLNLWLEAHSIWVQLC